jgi:hypothetical protein
MAEADRPTAAGRAREQTLAVAAVAAVLALAGCATQPPLDAHDPPGFSLAVVRGLTAPVTLVPGLVLEMRIYAFPKGGWPYNLGHVIGLGPCAFAGLLLAGSRL